MPALEGRRILVTGGSRGIGRAIAIGFAREGADVAVLGRDAATLGPVVEEVTGLGRTGIAVAADIVDHEAVVPAVGEAAAALGGLNVVVNNAGGGRERTHVGDDDPAVWREVVELNLLGTYHVCRAALPHLRAAGGGTIVNVGSGMGHQARAGNSSYNCAKAGQWMLTRCLANELWEDDITVNELIPGPVATELTAGIFEVDRPHPAIPAEWVKRPEEVVPLAIHLAEQGAKGPTGQSFSLARRPL